MNALSNKFIRSAVTSAVARRLGAGLSVLPARARRNTRRGNTRKARRLPRRVRGPGLNRSMTRAMPAAYAAHVRPRFNVSTRTATSAIVSGCDLIYPIPANLSPTSDTIFAMFPANPAYWMGTRISQFAPAYQNYRPLSFVVSYIPQVAVTQQGTVFMGTLWNEAAPSDNIQQSLFTSNGGCLTQCYVPADTEIKLGRNLQQNLFTMNESLNPDTCPFMFLAGVRGADVVPGYFYVSYTYEFRNPIGSAWAFNASGLTTFGALATLPTYANMTFVLAEQAGGFGPGTQLDLEVDGKVFYHGSEITLDDSVSGVLYSNQQSAITTNTLASYFTLSSVTLGITTTDFADFLQPSGVVSIPDGSAYVSFVQGSTYSTISFRKNDSGSAVNITPGSPYLIVATSSDRVTVNTASGSVYASMTDADTDSLSTNLTVYPPYRIAA